MLESDQPNVVESWHVFSSLLFFSWTFELFLCKEKQFKKQNASTFDSSVIFVGV